MEKIIPMIDKKDHESFEMSDSLKEDKYSETDYYDGASYQGWEKKTFTSAAGQYIRHNGILFVSIGVGIAVLFILFKLLPTTQIGTDKKHLMALEGRMAQLEERLDQILKSVAKAEGESPAGASGVVDSLTSRVERIESSLLARVDELADKLNKKDGEKPAEGTKPTPVAPKPAESTKSAPVAPKPAESKKPAVTTAKPAPVSSKPDEVAKRPAQPPAAQPSVQQTPAQQPAAQQPKETNKRVHMVQPKETLFSISQKYDIPVDEIRKLNNMSAADVLKSGQRLVVSK